jgi:chemotaxis protein MotB
MRLEEKILRKEEEGISMSRFRRREENDAENTHLWLLTYSDIVTLCLTFFVLLYSFSTLDTIKWKSVVTSLQGALGVLDGSNTPADKGIYDKGNSDEINQDNMQKEAYLKYQEEMKRLEDIKNNLNEYILAQELQDNVVISIEERGVVIRFQDSVLFPKGSADLFPESTTILSGISVIFKNLNNPIRIEGHTDNLPIHTEHYPSNWELSTARATNVLRFLIEQGIEGKQLSAVGYGEYHPVEANTTEENRKKNRRVDIVLIRESMLINEPK